LRPWFQILCAKIGYVAKRRGRSIVVLPADRPTVEAASELLAELQRRYPRLNFVFLAGPPALRAWLSARFPNDRVVPFPWLVGPLLGGFLARVNTQLVLVLGAMSQPTERVLARALADETAAAIVGLDGGVHAWSLPGSEAPSHHAGRLSVPRANGTATIVGGAAADRLTVVAPPEQPDLDLVVEQLVPLIALERPERTSRPVRLLARLLRNCLSGPPGHRWVAGLVGRKYETFDTPGQLAAALGHPRTLLCLGNGPSSEDPRLQGIRFDCLFRANHSWLDRGFLTAADAVFTGAMPSILAIRRPVIFCLHNHRAEQRLLVRGLRMSGRIRFANVQRFGLVDPAKFDAHLPTNGAMMLATAVALRPQRLIVAGIDLFQDPRGPYPGGSMTPNAYTACHDRSLEERFILDTLDGYDGELVILSPVLEESWRAYGSERRAELAPATEPLRA
jgi:hypothetical protein